MKKILFTCFLTAILCSPLSLDFMTIGINSASAGAMSTSYTYTNPVTVNSFSEWFGNLLVRIQGIVGWIAVVMLMIGGMVYITSGGNQAQTTRGKAIIITSLIGFAIAVAAPSLLREVRDIALAGLGGPAPGVIAGAKPIQDIVEDIMNFLLALIGVVSIISFVYGGFTYITSNGDQASAEKGKNVVTYSLIAISLAGAALIILRQVIAILS